MEDFKHLSSEPLQFRLWASRLDIRKNFPTEQVMKWQNG